MNITPINLFSNNVLYKRSNITNRNHFKTQSDTFGKSTSEINRTKETKRLEKLHLAEYMQYVLENVMQPEFTHSINEADRHVEHREYDEITNVYFAVNFHDIRLEQALKYISKYGGKKEYNELLEFFDTNKDELNNKEKELNNKLNDMETNLKIVYDSNNEMADGGDITLEYIKSVQKQNPITMLKQTIDMLEFSEK